MLSMYPVLFNDMTTNHFIRPRGSMTNLERTTPFDGVSYTYDPYAKCLWITSRNGKLIKDSELVTEDVYRQVYAQAAMKKQELQMAVAMSQHSRLGELSLMHLMGANTVRELIQYAFE